MNSNIYHITNGDALTERLQGLKLEGFLFTMRECMIDGPVECSGDWATFFSSREVFIYEQFGKELSYEDYVLSQLKKMKSIPEGNTIYFWFEDDLFCQANWWFLICYLKDVKATKYLVRSGDISPYSFAHLDDSQLLKAFKDKKELVEEELTSLWQHYTNTNHNRVEVLPEVIIAAYPFVKKAFQAHLDRLSSTNSLGLPKETLKAIGEELAFENFGKVFQEFQKRLPYYGYGDLQVQNMIKELI